MRCTFCHYEAIGYNVDMYHDSSPISATPTCYEHSVAGDPPHETEYDDYGYSIYRPDPTFVPMSALADADDIFISSVLRTIS